MDVLTPQQKTQRLLHALVVLLAWHGVPYWLHDLTWNRLARWLWQEWNWHGVFGWSQLYFDGLCLLLGVCLLAPSLSRYGFRIGDIRKHWPWVLLVCGGPLIVSGTAMSFMAGSLPRWLGSSVSIWLVSPLAQGLVFGGFIYTTIEEAFPGNLHRRLPMRRGLLIAGLFFSFSHLTNFAISDAWFVCFQLFYTYVGFLCVGLSRQWTGSFCYATLSHTAGNFLAWWFVSGRHGPPPQLLSLFE